MVNLPSRIELLGGLAIVRGGVRIERFRSRKTALLLAYLALQNGRPVAREILVDALWPEDDQDAARNRFRVALNSLRHQLEPPGVRQGDVLGASRTDAWLVKESVRVDVQEFRFELDRARKADDQGKRIEALLGALELYRGELLPGYYEEWIDVHRREAERLFSAAATDAVDLLLALERQQEALPIALRLAAQDLLDESAQRRLIQTYGVLGQSAKARAVYDSLCDRLQEELGVEPSDETTQLLEELPKLRRQEPAPREADTAAPISVRSDLPTPASSFHGRVEELLRLSDLLNRKGSERTSRLITLAGPGGIGKTRLALQAARANEGYFDGGCWFVPLAETEHGSQIGQAIGDAIHVRISPHLGALEQVIEELRARAPALVVLDNFEQVVETGREIVRRLLADLPGLSVLVTSRSHLGLPEEHIFQVDPLDVPKADLGRDRMIESGGVGLFVARAQAAQPDFQLTDRNAQTVAELCRKLEGIPLAIELAGARIRLLTADQMIRELGHRFELLVNRKAGEGFRHRSIKAVLEQSVEMLPEPSREFFANMSSFRGSWNLEAARAVSRRADALDLLDDLVGFSLIRAEVSAAETRYSMLETIREFAAFLLTEDSRGRLESDHARFYGQWAEENEGSSLSRKREEVRVLNDLEIDNLRAAWNWSLNRQPIQALEIAANLRWLYFINGRLGEGADMLTRSLESTDGAPNELVAKALVSLGAVRCWSDDFVGAEEVISQALSMLRPSSGREWRLATSFAGWATVYNGNVEEGYAQLAEAGRLCAEQGEVWSVGTCFNLMGFAACFAERYEDARDHFEESYAMLVEAGDSATAAHSFLGLGRVAWVQGDLDGAEVQYRTALAEFRSHHERRGEAYAIEGLARVASSKGIHAEAIGLLASAQSLRDRAALKRDPRDQTDHDAVVATASSSLTKTEIERAWQEGLRRADVPSHLITGRPAKSSQVS